MLVVEYQLTTSEVAFIAIRRELKTPRSIISTLLVLFGVFMLTRGKQADFFGYLMAALVSGFLFLRLWLMYREIKANHLFTLRTRLSVGETGILMTTAVSRTERTWQALYSWSQSKKHFYLYIDKKRTVYILIPKRVFTDEQVREFNRYMKKINTYQPSEKRRRTEEISVKEDNLSGVRLPRLPQLNNAKTFVEREDTLTGKVFLSYAREDIYTALRLFNDLRQAGIDVWIDKEHLLPGQNWKTTIRRAIRESRFFLALLSNNSVSKKGYVQKELRHALELLDEYPEPTIFVIPIRIDDCNPTSEKLKELHWVDIFDDWEEGLARIFKTMKSQRMT